MAVDPPTSAEGSAPPNTYSAQLAPPADRDSRPSAISSESGQAEFGGIKSRVYLFRRAWCISLTRKRLGRFERNGMRLLGGDQHRQIGSRSAS
jgi:hypothetical protein